MRAVNLIPTDQRAGTAIGSGRSEGAAYAVLGLLAGVVILALLYGVAAHQISSRRSQLASLNQRAQQAKESAGHLAPYTSFIALREQRVQAVEQLASSRFDWAHAMHELGRVLPAGVWITSLDGTVGSPSSTASGSSSSSSSSHSGAATSSAVSSVTPPGSVPTFTLSGCAVAQASVAKALNRLRLIDGVAEVTLQNSTKAGVAGGSGGGSSSVECPHGFPAYTINVSFAPLPAASATNSASGSGTAQNSAATSPGGAG
jgi:hypothetical protein